MTRIGIHMHRHRLSFFHVIDLRLFEIRDHPFVLAVHHCKERLARLYELSRLHIYF